MSDPSIANSEQAQLWNDRAGRTWVELGDMLDALLAPFATMLVDEIGPVAQGRILDVGCGSGAVTLELARRSGPGASCLGVDISAPLIEAARGRAAAEGLATAAFRQADAESHPFDAGAFDAIVSRFGIMFFADPVAAFRNLARATRSGGRLACIAWRSAAENDFMTTAERVASAMLPDFPQRDTHGPGQFAFGDREKVRGILEASGWREIAIDPVDVTCLMPRDALRTYVTRMGPLRGIFPTLDEETRARLVAGLDAAFAPFVEGDEVRFIAACWRVTARA